MVLLASLGLFCLLVLSCLVLLVCLVCLLACWLLCLFCLLACFACLVVNLFCLPLVRFFGPCPCRGFQKRGMQARALFYLVAITPFLASGSAWPSRARQPQGAPRFGGHSKKPRRATAVFFCFFCLNLLFGCPFWKEARCPSALSQQLLLVGRGPLLEGTTEKSWYQLIMTSLLEDLVEASKQTNGAIE